MEASEKSLRYSPDSLQTYAALATTAREWDSFNMISADGPFAGPPLDGG
ncbi:hypothetical protein [Pseudophaeobacter sp. C1-32P7]